MGRIGQSCQFQRTSPQEPLAVPCQKPTVELLGLPLRPAAPLAPSEPVAALIALDQLSRPRDGRSPSPAHANPGRGLLTCSKWGIAAQSCERSVGRPIERWFLRFHHSTLALAMSLRLPLQRLARHAVQQQRTLTARSFSSEGAEAQAPQVLASSSSSCSRSLGRRASLC